MDFLISNIGLLPLVLLLFWVVRGIKIPIAIVASMLLAYFFPLALFSVKGISIQIMSVIILFLYTYINRAKVKILQGHVQKVYWSLVVCSFVLYLLNLLFCSEIQFKVIGTVMTVLTSISSFVIAYSCVTFATEKKELDFLSSVVAVIAAVASIYSICCYYIGVNPFGIFLQSLFDYAEDYSEDMRGTLSGRVQGFQTHPLHFAGSILCALFVVHMSFVKSETILKKVVFGFFIVLLFVTLFYTGCRSGIVACFCGFGLFYTIQSGRKSLFYLVILISLVYILGIDQYVDMGKSSLLYSVTHFWEQNDEISGSSLDMRINQLVGTRDLVFTDVQTALWGKGTNWCNAYVTKFGHHPILEGFESILFKWPIELGILGFALLFYIMFVKPYTIVRSMPLGIEKKLLCCFLLSFSIFTVMTGCYALDLFVVSVALLIRYCNMNSLKC